MSILITEKADAAADIIRRYAFFIVLFFINGLSLVLYPAVSQKSLQIIWSNAIELLSVIPPIFILLELLDVWIQRENMIKLTDEKSGFIG